MSGNAMGGSPQDAVAAAQKMTEQLRETLDRSRQSPENELGLSAEEIERRRKLASSPHKFTGTGTSRQFDVKSSARAQQIMSQGVDKSQREKRLRDVNKRIKIMRKAQIVSGLLGVAFMGWFTVEILIPRYSVVQNRNRAMQLRREMAEQRLQVYLESQSPPPPPPPPTTNNELGARKNWWRHLWPA